MTAGRSADAYAAEWAKCSRCGTRRPPEALCPLIVNFTELRCLDLDWCSRAAGIGKGCPAGLEGGPEVKP